MNRFSRALRRARMASGGDAGDDLANYQPASTMDLARSAARDPYLQNNPMGVANPGSIRNLPERPNDYLSPVSEAISPTMGAYGMGQAVGNVIGNASEYKLPDPMDAAALAMAVMPGQKGWKTAPRSPLGYYSALDEALMNLGPKDRVTPDTLAKMGVKRAELDARGLGGAFDSGPASVADLQAAARPVGLNEKAYTYNADTRAAYNAALAKRQALEQRYGARAAMQRPEYLEIQADIDRLMAEQKNGPRWSSYSLDPSNPTYRETVLHLPGVEGNPDWIDLSRKIEDIGNQQTELGRQFYTADPARRAELDRLNDQLIDQKTALADQRYELEKRLRSEQFQSGHFPEPNIIGHMMTSMTSHEGKPVYTIDQIQSDWGQKLRDGGVRDEAKIAALREQVQQAEKALDVAHRTAEQKARDAGQYIGAIYSDPALQQANADLNRTLAELRTAEASSPGHPLVNTTDQWVNTTLRRALQQAADANADHIAIPSGDTVLSYNPGDTHGMNTFYNQIVPKNLGNILRKIDPNAVPQQVPQLQTPSGPKGNGFSVFPLSEEARAKIKQGLPLFSAAPLVAGSVMDQGDTQSPYASGGKVSRALNRSNFAGKVRDIAAKHGLPVGGMTTTGITVPYSSGGLASDDIDNRKD